MKVTRVKRKMRLMKEKKESGFEYLDRDGVFRGKSMDFQGEIKLGVNIRR